MRLTSLRYMRTHDQCRQFCPRLESMLHCRKFLSRLLASLFLWWGDSVGKDHWSIQRLHLHSNLLKIKRTWSQDKHLQMYDPNPLSLIVQSAHSPYHIKSADFVSHHEIHSHLIYILNG